MSYSARSLSLQVGGLLLMASAACGAQTMKPGLWEMQNQMQGSGESGQAMAKMQEELAAMPPDQRKMMQDMMAKQGVKMGTGAGGGMAVKVCISEEMAKRNEVASPNDHCTQTASPRVGNSMKFSYVCTQPPSSGEGQVTFDSPGSYSMRMTSTTQVKGKAEKKEMQSKARWLGADCGGLKPMQAKH